MVRPIYTSMKRREFLKLGGAATLSLLSGAQNSYASGQNPQTFYVATDGSDMQPGTLEKPFATLHRAQQAVRDFRSGHHEAALQVVVRKGTYYLHKTLILTAEDSGTAHAPVMYTAYAGERVTLSGGRKLDCKWQTRKSKSICDLNSGNSGPFAFTQLFINGKRQVRARFPDYDPADPIHGGYATVVRALPAGTSSPYPEDNDADVSKRGVLGIEFDPDTFSSRRWGKPEEAIIHVFQQDGLGILEWKIQSVDYDRNRIWFGKGGDQLGPQWSTAFDVIGKGSRFYVDNVLEEMSIPGEWYLSVQSGRLWYRQQKDQDLENALIEAPVLEQVVRFQGTYNSPVEYVSFDGFRIAHTETTYMKPYESSSSGNWAVHRGGAIFLEGTRNCSIRNCWFDSVGGNAIFWSRSNVAGNVAGCKFTEAGDNAICFVGDPRQSLSASPIGCTAVDNLIHNCGIFGKQIAGVYISYAQATTVAHNDIHAMPCSAICIEGSAWGGHLIEQNYIHNTVQETRHYGSLNLRGDDRGWNPEHISTLTSVANGTPTENYKSKPTLVKENLIQEKTDCGILLANGAAMYEVYNNVSIGAAIYMYGGALRNIYNNIWYMTDNAGYFWLDAETYHDKYHHNVAVITGKNTYILSTQSKQPRIDEIDFNCLSQGIGDFQASIIDLQEEKEFKPPTIYTQADWQKLGYDQHSAFANPLIADPAHMNFRLLDGSPALKLGFVNFTMGKWGPRKGFSSVWEEM